MRSVDTVASTARPMAPPTCVVVLMRPEASPASLGVAPDIASIIRAGKARPAPMPSSSITGSTSTTQLPSTGARANSSRPAVADDEAGDQRRLGADAHDQLLGVAQRQRAHHEARGQEGQADLERAVAEDRCM